MRSRSSSRRTSRSPFRTSGARSSFQSGGTMTPRRREIETLLLTSFAAVPLYMTHAVGTLPLVMFHAVMAGIILRVAMGKSPELIPATVMRMIAILYVGFYVIDAAFISRNAIAASTHLVLFIATYQPIESARV